MQPFNVEICRGDTSFTYTILPENSYYSIMFNDKIIGAIADEAGKWIEVPLANVQSHDLEIVSSGIHQNGSVLQLPIEEIGREISLRLAGLPEDGNENACA